MKTTIAILLLVIALPAATEASDTSRMLQRMHKINAPREAAQRREAQAREAAQRREAQAREAARKREEQARAAKERERMAQEELERQEAEQRRQEADRLARRREAARDSIARWELFDPKHILQPTSSN